MATLEAYKKRIKELEEKIRAIHSQCEEAVPHLGEQ